jgi:hypothetical protein
MPRALYAMERVALLNVAGRRPEASFLSGGLLPVIPGGNHGQRAVPPEEETDQRQSAAAFSAAVFAGL